MASETPSRIPAVLQRIWHLLDNVRWMDPLPPLHRRGIVIALLVMLLAFLWPASTPQYPVERPAESSGKEVPMQAEIYDNNAQPPQNTTPKVMPRANGTAIPWPRARRWHSCSVTTICQSMMCLPWRGWKAMGSR